MVLVNFVGDRDPGFGCRHFKHCRQMITRTVKKPELFIFLLFIVQSSQFCEIRQAASYRKLMNDWNS